MKKLGLDGLEIFWVRIFSLMKLVTGDVKVNSKGTLQEQIDDMSKKVDDCFTSASNGKKAIASAITGKGVSTASDATFATMATNIGNIKTSPMLQAKNAALSTTAQTIKPDTGYDGLSQVSVPAVSGNAGTGDVLANKTFSSGSAGISKTGTMPNKGAWIGATTGNGNVTIPAGYHNGQGHVSGAGAYNAGVSAADGRVNADSANYRGGYNAGVSATKKGTAGAGDVLSGKTFTNSSNVGASGTMPNKGAWTGATTGSGNVAIPAGYHNGQGHVSGAGAYNKGVTDADARVNANSANYKGGYNAGVSAADGRVNADSANYKGGYNAGVSATKKGTAGAGDVLSGKTFTNSSNVETSGTMANKGSTTQDATATQDDTYTYLTVPVAGYYNTASKLRTKNSNLTNNEMTIQLKCGGSSDGQSGGASNTSHGIMVFDNPGYKTVTMTDGKNCKINDSALTLNVAFDISQLTTITARVGHSKQSANGSIRQSNGSVTLVFK